MKLRLAARASPLGSRLQAWMVRARHPEKQKGCRFKGYQRLPSRVAAGSGLRQVMKPHQGLAPAATCQLWQRTFQFQLVST